MQGCQETLFQSLIIALNQVFESVGQLKWRRAHIRGVCLVRLRQSQMRRCDIACTTNFKKFITRSQSLMK